MDPANEDNIIAGTDNLYAYSQQAKTLSPINDGTGSNSSGRYVHPYIINLKYIGNTLYTATDGGVYYSETNGQSWRQEMNAGLSTLAMYGGDLFVDGKGDVTAFVATADNIGLLKCSVGDVQWQLLGGNLYGDCFISPSDPSKTVAGGYGGLYRFSGATPSTNLAASIMQNGWPFLTEFGISNLDENVGAICGTMSLYLTTDGFNTITLTGGSGSGNTVVREPFCVAFAPNSSTDLYVGSQSNVYYTHSLGASWAKSSSSISGSVNTVAPDIQIPDLVYIAIGGSKKFMVSHDGGVTFQAVASNLPTGTFLTVDGTAGSVFIGGDHGVFYSKDTGITWQPLMDQFPNALVTTLKIRGHYLIATTIGRGMYYLDLNRLTSSNGVAETQFPPFLSRSILTPHPIN